MSFDQKKVTSGPGTVTTLFGSHIDDAIITLHFLQISMRYYTHE